MRLRTSMLALGLLAACAAGPGDPGDPNIQRLPVDSLVMAPGHEARIQLLRLSFLEVGEDSRCPVDVVCIWQGNAEVRVALAIGTGPSYPFSLNTSEGFPTAELAGYRVTLLGLTPAPRSDRTIPADAYRASFRVEAAD